SFPIQRLSDMGYKIFATTGTASVLRRNGIECETVKKSSEIRNGAEGRSVVDLILDREIDLVINTPDSTSGARFDGYEIRSVALEVDVPQITTVQGVTAGVQALAALPKGEFKVRALEEIQHARVIYCPASRLWRAPCCRRAGAWPVVRRHCPASLPTSAVGLRGHG